THKIVGINLQNIIGTLHFVNAPYQISVLLRSAFGIAIITNQSDYLQRQVRIIVGLTAKLSRHD
ncbi:hypothetical protein, partial [Microcystis aeruginosa]|uniref:hypothetical protein n=1 Tax=Microcystis aeruginosa TaxID=1126 RepID=UPI0015583B26